MVKRKKSKTEDFENRTKLREAYFCTISNVSVPYSGIVSKGEWTSSQHAMPERKRKLSEIRSYLLKAIADEARRGIREDCLSVSVRKVKRLI